MSRTEYTEEPGNRLFLMAANMKKQIILLKRMSEMKNFLKKRRKSLSRHAMIRKQNPEV